MTIEQKINLMKKMANNFYACAKIFEKDGDEDMAHSNNMQAIAFKNCIEILTDDKFAEELNKIYKDAE